MQTLTQKTLKIFWRHAWRYKWQVTLIIIGVVGHTILQNYTPILYGRLIDAVSRKNATNDLQPAIDIIWLILTVSLIRLTVARSFNFINNYFQPRVMADLNNSCFAYVHRHSYAFFSNNFVGSLVTKVKRYERSFEQIADQLTFDLGRTFLDTIVTVIVLLNVNRTIGLVILGWALLYLLFSYLFSQYKLPIDIKRANTDTEVTAQLADSITNNFNIKTFASYQTEEAKFGKVANNQFLWRKKSWDLGTISEAIQSVSMVLLEFLLLYLAVRYWQRGVITIGAIALLQAYLMRLFDKLWSAGKHMRAIYEAMADANEMTEMLIRPHEITDAQGSKTLKIKSGQIDFKAVNFGYHKMADVLNNFSLTIKPGERVALIGPSGGGKSTIVKLLFRFYDLGRGEISVDGQDISKVTQDSLRAQLSLVPQDPILFHRSLMENIRYARGSASHDEVVDAAKKAHAHEFISNFTEGYNTLVGERGVKLSGGERQRVAIARAILKNAPILVLDEATSSLDSQNEMYIQDALKTLMKGKTTIVIAHRLSTIMQMDRIVVIDNGKVVEQGKHQELLKVQEGLYQRLWEIQAGGFATT
ncbi:MAG: ABC transporter ATP-binding protein [Candidatus Doudnabacteria bacterium]|nr:ABC transporter ATP-binding protein [Candidatus Doudnabacteria bacterium]